MPASAFVFIGFLAVQVRCNTTREELETMLESSGVLDAIMAPVEQVLQRAAAADVKVDALELCDLQQSSVHRCAAFAPLSRVLRTGTAGPRVCR